MGIWLIELIELWAYAFLPASVALILFSIEVGARIRQNH